MKTYEEYENARDYAERQMYELKEELEYWEEGCEEWHQALAEYNDAENTYDYYCERLENY